jgi:predicted transcriptional regulator of viral defense system
MALAEDRGVLRPRDLQARGIPRVYLQDLYERGLLQRLGRGVYAASDTDLSEHHSLAEVCAHAPRAAICLLSALRFHDLTTQNPRQVWVTLPLHAHRPRLDYPPLRLVYASGAALTSGVEDHHIEGVLVRVYSPAKTVADCFKYRSKVGLDVALDALRDCWRARRCTMEDLWRYAEVCRVANVMRPYLEAIAR